MPTICRDDVSVILCEVMCVASRRAKDEDGSPILRQENFYLDINVGLYYYRHQVCSRSSDINSFHNASVSFQAIVFPSAMRFHCLSVTVLICCHPYY